MLLKKSDDFFIIFLPNMPKLGLPRATTGEQHGQNQAFPMISPTHYTGTLLPLTKVEKAMTGGGPLSSEHAISCSFIHHDHLFTNWRCDGADIPVLHR